MKKKRKKLRKRREKEEKRKEKRKMKPNANPHIPPPYENALVLQRASVPLCSDSRVEEQTHRPVACCGECEASECSVELCGDVLGPHRLTGLGHSETGNNKRSKLRTTQHRSRTRFALTHVLTHNNSNATTLHHSVRAPRSFCAGGGKSQIRNHEIT